MPAVNSKPAVKPPEELTRRKKYVKRSRRVAFGGIDAIYDQFPNYDESQINAKTAAFVREDNCRKLIKEFPKEYFRTGEHNLVKPNVCIISLCTKQI